MKPYLPQNDPNPEQRSNALRANREQYNFIYLLDKIPVLDPKNPPPAREGFTAEYTVKRLASMASLPPNMLAAKTKNFIDPLDTLEEYHEELLALLPKPDLIEYFRKDDFFAEQRLSGANPMAIRRIDAIPEDFAADNALFKSVAGSDRDLSEALAEGKVYFVDYPCLDGIKGGKTVKDGIRKYMPKVRGLFYWRDGDSSKPDQLLTIAIELRSESSGKRLIYTPNDNELDWLFAKLCFQTAEGNQQELGSHFSYTHAAMAPFAIVSARQLGENHPLSILFRPHFRFMLHDNYLGLTSFLNPGGPVDNFMAGTLEESLGFVGKVYDGWNLDDFQFPKEIARRNMEDAGILPHYPFRDDGMLLWNEIKDFIGSYLELYYQTPEDIAADFELQNWAKELAAENGGRVKGMPDSIRSVAQLADIVSVVIFSCAPLHSALNFAQYEYMAYVPNMPYAAYQPVPDQKGGMTMETIMKFLPPFKPAADQVFWTMVLTSYQCDQIGDYEAEFEDPRAREAVRRFRQNLAQVEKEIDRRNAVRAYPYKYFKPSNIMNSINT